MGCFSLVLGAVEEARMNFLIVVLLIFSCNIP